MNPFPCGRLFFTAQANQWPDLWPPHSFSTEHLCALSDPHESGIRPYQIYLAPQLNLVVLNQDLPDCLEPVPTRKWQNSHVLTDSVSQNSHVLTFWEQSPSYKLVVLHKNLFNIKGLLPLLTGVINAFLPPTKDSHFGWNWRTLNIWCFIKCKKRKRKETYSCIVCNLYLLITLSFRTKDASDLLKSLTL